MVSHPRHKSSYHLLEASGTDAATLVGRAGPQDLSDFWPSIFMDCQWNTTGKLFALGKVYESHFKRVTIEFNTVIANANGMCTRPKMVKCDQCIPCQCLFRWMSEQVGFPWEQWKDANCTTATKPSIHLYSPLFSCLRSKIGLTTWHTQRYSKYIKHPHSDSFMDIH